MTTHVGIVRFAFAIMLMILPLAACSGVGASGGPMDGGIYGR